MVSCENGRTLLELQSPVSESDALPPPPPARQHPAFQAGGKLSIAFYLLPWGEHCQKPIRRTGSRIWSLRTAGFPCFGSISGLPHVGPTAISSGKLWLLVTPPKRRQSHVPAPPNVSTGQPQVGNINWRANWRRKTCPDGQRRPAFCEVTLLTCYVSYGI